MLLCNFFLFSRFYFIIKCMKKQINEKWTWKHEKPYMRRQMPSQAVWVDSTSWKRSCLGTCCDKVTHKLRMGSGDWAGILAHSPHRRKSWHRGLRPLGILCLWLGNREPWMLVLSSLWTFYSFPWNNSTQLRWIFLHQLTQDHFSWLYPNVYLLNTQISSTCRY